MLRVTEERFSDEKLRISSLSLKKKKKKKKKTFLFSAIFLFFGSRQNIYNILLACTDCERMRILEIKLHHEIDAAN